MTPHEQVFQVLGDLVDGRVYPGIAEPDTPCPYVTFQVIGGPPINFVTGETPAKRFVRLQVNVWGAGVIEAAQVAAQVEDSLRGAKFLHVEVLTGATDTYDDVTKYHGTMQDFQLFL